MAKTFAKALYKFIIRCFLLGTLSACASIDTGSSKRPEVSKQELKLGEKILFYSHTLKENRSYLIRLPKSYNNTDIYPKRYPVLYILDGESHFEYASGMVDFMSAAGVTNNYQIPELIVVAITNKQPAKDNRFRDYSPTLVHDYYEDSGGGDSFLKFLRDEVIPRVEAEYRTMPLRVLAGHSMGGLITVYDLLSTPSIFNAHIAMDPSLWWDNKLMLSKAQKLKDGLLRSPFYLSTYGKAQRKEESRSFVATLAKKNPPPFRSKFQVFKSEGHGSLPIVSLYNGLLFIFEGFHPHLNGFVDDPTSIDKHFRHLSRTLGVDFLPPEDLIHEVCSHTATDNPSKAIECFQVNVSNYPLSYNARNAMAKIYTSKGMKQQAITSYLKSLELKPGNPEAINGLAEVGEN